MTPSIRHTSVVTVITPVKAKSIMWACSIAERSRRAQDQGAAMVMVMPPYHGATLRVGEPLIDEFFHRLSDAIDIPIMIQDAPVSGIVLSAAFLASFSFSLYIKIII